MNLSKLTDDELALLAHHGDSEAVSVLWERLVDLVSRLARSFCQKYPHIDFDDLSQSILLHVPKIIDRYVVGKTPFRRYAAVTLYRAGQDELRKNDPLGVRIPQKTHYPEFTHLSIFTGHEDQSIDVIVNDGIDRIRKGVNHVPHNTNQRDRPT